MRSHAYVFFIFPISRLNMVLAPVFLLYVSAVSHLTLQSASNPKSGISFINHFLWINIDGPLSRCV